MAETRKSFLLRIPPDLWDQVNLMAQAELRSVNAQIEFMLREGVKRRMGKSSPTPPSEASAPNVEPKEHENL